MCTYGFQNMKIRSTWSLNKLYLSRYACSVDTGQMLVFPFWSESNKHSCVHAQMWLLMKWSKFYMLTLFTLVKSRWKQRRKTWLPNSSPQGDVVFKGGPPSPMCCQMWEVPQKKNDEVFLHYELKNEMYTIFETKK